MKRQPKLKFLLKNILRGILWTAVIAVLYILFKEFIYDNNQEAWIERFYGKPLIIYLIYLGSEVFFGIIPPEFFMIWAYHKADILQYVLNLTFFAAISYGAGYLAFLVGRFLRRVVLFRYLGRRFFSKYWPLFRKYGSVLIIAAALTPLPWSTISMLVGTTEYPMSRYIYIALFRVLRFIVYGYIIFQGHQFA
ncbi:hypothetical protein ACUNWD_15450 [Sunxiuqinia sp. A32]|uniref:hypothetical protein n=1 Tax=Sunxiuqinia sp. A32 TaxID=3461496 RepID=UPI0040459B1D